MSPTDERNRFQVPVSNELAEEIVAMANRLRRSPRWMATELLDVVIADRKSLADHMAAKVAAFLSGAAALLHGRSVPKPTKEPKVVHLDLALRPATANAIAALATNFGHTPAKMAGVMLQWGVRENDFAIRLASRLMDQMQLSPAESSEAQGEDCQRNAA